jgi:hypothetical protein
VYELGLIMEFKTLGLLAGGPQVLFRGLSSDIKLGATLFFKGKFGILPERVKQLGEVARLYEEAAREQ